MKSPSPGRLRGSILIQIDPRTPVIVVEVELAGPAGSRVVQMALDTGATFVMLPWVVTEALGYHPAVSRKRINVHTASSVEVVPVVTVTDRCVESYMERHK